MIDKNYVDLVVCKHDGCDAHFLFQAPAWSGLEEGDLVIVYGDQKATVMNKITVDPTSEEYDFIVDATNAIKPLKRVLKKVTFRDFVYEEVDNEQSNNDQ